MTAAQEIAAVIRRRAEALEKRAESAMSATSLVLLFCVVELHKAADEADRLAKLEELA